MKDDDSGVVSNKTNLQVEKFDNTLPRSCHLKLIPGFDGLGIHVSCNPETCRSPYIHRVEANSPGIIAGLRKGDFILAINNENAVDMEFTHAISLINEKIEARNLVLTVGNQKAMKKWIKSHKFDKLKN